MNLLNSMKVHGRAVDEDLVEQALPGHGVPSQDPDPLAQVALTPEETERESLTVFVGGGVILGMLAGAAIGLFSSGIVGWVVGASVGGLIGLAAGSKKFNRAINLVIAASH